MAKSLVAAGESLDFGQSVNQHNLRKVEDLSRLIVLKWWALWWAQLGRLSSLVVTSLARSIASMRCR